MDRNSPDDYIKNCQQNLDDTRSFVHYVRQALTSVVLLAFKVAASSCCSSGLLTAAQCSLSARNFKASILYTHSLRAATYDIWYLFEGVEGAAHQSNTCRDLKSTLVEPVITPRFVPTCTPELLQGLGQIAAETGAPVQSHISESLDEVAFATHLHPEACRCRAFCSCPAMRCNKDEDTSPNQSMLTWLLPCRCCQTACCCLC